MTDDATALHALGQRLVGEWTHDATHPALPGTVVRGGASIEWLEGERFIIWRSHTDHPDFPDSVSIIGDTDGLHWHYFDSRGVHRVYGVTMHEDGLEIGGSTPEFDQRMRFTFADGDDTLIGKSQLSEDRETWNDDLELTARRAR